MENIHVDLHLGKMADKIRNLKMRILTIIVVILLISVSFSVSAQSPTPATTSTPAPTASGTPKPSATPGCKTDTPDCDGFDRSNYCDGSTVKKDEGKCNTGSGTCYAQTTTVKTCKTAYGTCEKCDGGECKNDDSKLTEPKCQKCSGGTIEMDYDGKNFGGIPLVGRIVTHPSSHCCCGKWSAPPPGGSYETSWDLCKVYDFNDQNHCGFDCSKDCDRVPSGDPKMCRKKGLGTLPEDWACVECKESNTHSTKVPTNLVQQADGTWKGTDEKVVYWNMDCVPDSITGDIERKVAAMNWKCSSGNCQPVAPATPWNDFETKMTNLVGGAIYDAAVGFTFGWFLTDVLDFDPFGRGDYKKGSGGTPPPVPPPPIVTPPPVVTPR